MDASLAVDRKLVRSRHLVPQLSFKRIFLEWFALLNGMSRHIRAAWRGFLLLASLLFGALRFAATSLWQRLRGSRISPMQRAEWMHFCGRMVLAALGIRYRVEGTPPTGSTLIAANHLSYLDIVIFSAALPAAFVAKHDIGSWPGFGQLARMGGAIFVDRISRVSAWETAEEMTQRLAARVPVVLFPEGTSTDGSSVLRFHSRLFEPVIVAQAPITPAAIRYVLSDGTPERELCWFGDAGFLPHLWKTLGTAGFTAEVRFGDRRIYPHRRVAADQTYDEVVAMRAVDLVAQEQI